MSIKWYKNGKLTTDEKSISFPPVQVGDKVKIVGPLYFFDNEHRQNFDVNEWKTTDRKDEIHIVTHIKDIDSLFYSGYIIKLSGKWPWYQFTNMELYTK